MSPSPVKAAALELGLPVVTDDIDDVARRRCRARRGRGLRAADQAPRPRRAADGQRALLAAAAVARCGAGRAGAAGRRRGDRRVHHGRRGGLDTGAGVRLRRRADRAATTTAELAAAELVDVGTRLLVDALDGRAAGADAADRRADLRRQARRPTSCASTGSAPAVELDRWCAWAAPWTTFRGRRLKVLDVGRSWTVPSAEPGRLGADVATVGTGVSCGCSPCSRRASRRCAGPTSPTAPARPRRRAPRPDASRPIHPGSGHRRVCGREPQQTSVGNSGGRTATSSSGRWATTCCGPRCSRSATASSTAPGDDASGRALVEQLTAEGSTSSTTGSPADGERGPRRRPHRADRGLRRRGRHDRRHRVRPAGPDARGHPADPSSARHPGWPRRCASSARSAGCRGDRRDPRAGGHPQHARLAEGLRRAARAVLDVLPHALRLLHAAPTEH